MLKCNKIIKYREIMAPRVGFEPTTKWLTATYSTAELCRNVNTPFSARIPKVARNPYAATRISPFFPKNCQIR